MTDRFFLVWWVKCWPLCQPPHRSWPVLSFCQRMRETAQNQVRVRWRRSLKKVPFGHKLFSPTTADLPSLSIKSRSHWAEKKVRELAAKGNRLSKMIIINTGNWSASSALYCLFYGQHVALSRSLFQGLLKFPKFLKLLSKDAWHGLGSSQCMMASTSEESLRTSQAKVLLTNGTRFPFPIDKEQITLGRKEGTRTGCEEKSIVKDDFDVTLPLETDSLAQFCFLYIIWLTCSFQQITFSRLT